MCIVPQISYCQLFSIVSHSYASTGTFLTS
jgi:hypothetical protein